MKKRLFAIFLATAMVASMAACGSKSDDSSEAKEEQTTETDAETEDDGESEEAEKSVYFYMVCNGQTEYHEQGIAEGWTDSPLTQTGEDDATALGKGLADVEFASVYSSDLGRAISTAELAMEGRGLTVNTSESFREMNYGDLDGQPMGDDFFGEDYVRIYSEDGWSDVNGEIWNDLLSRILSELDVVAESSENGDNVFISTHNSGILGCAEILTDEDGLYQAFCESGAEELEGCSVSIFEYRDGQYILRSLNDTSYLEKGRE